jgi:molybdate transport system substrate-binding protein
MSRRAAPALAAIAVAALAVGCGSSSNATSATAADAPPIVLAAASLSKVFPTIDAGAHFTFGGSGALATDIEQGAPDDVYAAASPKDPALLYAKGLIDKPVPFATNTLVLIVPPGNPAHIGTVDDITKKGVKIVICNATVPCGDYARTAFANLAITAAAMKNVVSQATDVTQVVADVASGAADVGFVYITDAKAAKGKVKVVRLPAQAKPGTVDVIAVNKKAPNRAAAQALVATVLSAKGQAALHAAGFGPIPK